MYDDGAWHPTDHRGIIVAVDAAFAHEREHLDGPRCARCRERYPAVDRDDCCVLCSLSRFLALASPNAIATFIWTGRLEGDVR